MGAIVDFEWDSRDLAFWRGNVFDKSITRAMKMAGNKAIKTMQAESIQHITGRKSLKADDVIEDLPIVLPGRKAVLREMAWEEKVSGTPMPVAKFPFFQASHGVTVSINRGKSTQIAHAFQARMKNNHLGVFLRSGKFGRRGNPKLERIQELWTSRISDVMQDAGVIDRIQEGALRQLSTAFDKGLEREIQKLRRKGEL